MPIEHEVDGLRDLIITTISGVVGFQELHRAILGVAQLPGFHPTMGQLVDMSGCTEIHATYAEVEELARLRPTRAAYRAYVAPVAVVFGIARMYEQFRDDGRMMVVRTREEGLRWLEQQRQAP
ncbi:MAG TPA: hypothetical protein VEA99_05610 [Gemmatimonadaceae bacterium]|nr:hypothetical protein [Gemmatimonadaceae bacterium]